MGNKGEGGVKNLKKWVTSFTDSPIVYGMNIFPFYMSNCQIVKIVRKYILLLVPLPSRNLSKFSWLIALWKLLLLFSSFIGHHHPFMIYSEHMTNEVTTRPKTPSLSKNRILWLLHMPSNFSLNNFFSCVQFELKRLFRFLIRMNAFFLDSKSCVHWNEMSSIL